MTKLMSIPLTAVIAVFMISCSSGPQKAAKETTSAEQAKPAFQPSYETGREALQKMYIAARSWAIDAKPYRLQSQPTKDADGHNGKSGIWQAGFASPSKREIKLFTWSGIQADGAPAPGINSRPADTYSPANTSTEIFDIAFLKIDSQQAFDVAQKHGGEALVKKTPDLPVYYSLDWYVRDNKLYWHVLYGENRTDPKLVVDVDATTGQFVRVEK